MVRPNGSVIGRDRELVPVIQSAFSRKGGRRRGRLLQSRHVAMALQSATASRAVHAISGWAGAELPAAGLGTAMPRVQRRPAAALAFSVSAGAVEPPSAAGPRA